VSRGFFIANAIRSLGAWYELFKDDKDPDPFYTLGALVLILPRFVAFVLKLIADLLKLLLASDSQRAEYLADSMSARAGGTQAALSLLNRLLLMDSLATRLESFYRIGGKEGIFDALRRQAAHVPQRELERAARVEKSLVSRLDASHPPTANRIQLLQSRPAI